MTEKQKETIEYLQTFILVQVIEELRLCNMIGENKNVYCYLIVSFLINVNTSEKKKVLNETLLDVVICQQRLPLFH